MNTRENIILGPKKIECQYKSSLHKHYKEKDKSKVHTYVKQCEAVLNEQSKVSLYKCKKSTK